MTEERSYRRVSGANSVLIECAAGCEFDPDQAVPVRATAPGASEWAVLAERFEGSMSPSPVGGGTGKTRLTVSYDSETLAILDRLARFEIEQVLLRLADECFGRPPGDAIRFLCEACLLCLAGLDSRQTARQSATPRAWERLRDALLEVSFPYRSLPLFRVLRGDLECRRGPESADQGAAPALSGGFES